ncbi:MAG TPA: hypothetical protein VNV66_06290 [Pilimelia sp.]|nr:hypothetical protein [Pilimelia sp.]
MTLSEMLARIEDWLRVHAPATAGAFAPPVTDAQVARAERALGRRLHPDVLELLRWRDGADDTHLALPSCRATASWRRGDRR